MKATDAQAVLIEADSENKAYWQTHVKPKAVVISTISTTLFFEDGSSIRIDTPTSEDLRYVAHPAGS